MFKISKYALLLLQLLGLLFFLGCSRNSQSYDIPDTEALETQLSMVLPSAYIFLHHGESGRQGDDFQEWLLYSSIGFQIPKQDLSAASGRISISVQTAKDLFHDRLPKHNIDLVVDAYSFRWESIDYYYDSTVLQTESGEYILVARYPR